MLTARTIFGVILACSSVGCGGTLTAGIVTLPNETAAARKEFVPTEPLPADQVTYYPSQSKTKVTVPWSSLPDEEKNALLPIHRASIVTQQLDASGNAAYLAASVTGETGSYVVTMDFMKARVEEIAFGTSETGYAMVGVGLRVKAQIVTTKVGVNVGSPTALGVAAQAGFVAGSLFVEVIGLDSHDVSLLFPLPSTIDQTSIEKVLEAAASIKSKLGDPGTRLTPHVVAVQLTSTSSSDVEDLKASIPTASKTETDGQSGTQQQQPLPPTETPPPTEAPPQ